MCCFFGGPFVVVVFYNCVGFKFYFVVAENQNEWAVDLRQFFGGWMGGLEFTGKRRQKSQMLNSFLGGGWVV